MPNNKQHALICYMCYRKGHTSPTCILSVKDIENFIRNYEALTPMERLSIPSNSYVRMKKMFEAQEKGSAPNGSTVENPTTPSFATAANAALTGASLPKSKN